MKKIGQGSKVTGRRKEGHRSQATGHRKVFLALFFVFPVTCHLSPVSCPAQPISSTELIEHAKEYNNMVVEYEGEAVGDVMARREFAWVNVNDGRNAIGVWGKKAIIDSIVNRKGYYNCKGDIIRVNGIFHRACPEHGGDLDIHIDEIKKIKEGIPLSHPVDGLKIAMAFMLSIIALGLSILYAFKAGIKLWKKR